jgi:hypothetical protein
LVISFNIKVCKRLQILSGIFEGYMSRHFTVTCSSLLLLEM